MSFLVSGHRLDLAERARVYDATFSDLVRPFVCAAEHLTETNGSGLIAAASRKCLVRCTAAKSLRAKWSRAAALHHDAWLSSSPRLDLDWARL